ncbi:MAG: peptide chain release factor aRF-1 [Candidatus Heimdallarchaeota archaeon]
MAANLSDSFDRWRFCTRLKTLKRKKSDDLSTCLISLYVPPGRQLSDIINDLTSEAGTAENIKSKKTRKNVVQALNVLITRLKTLPGAKSKEKGFVIFTGVTEGGKMEYHYMDNLPYPVSRKLYVCDNKFRVEYLEEQLVEKDSFGLLVLDAGRATLATLSGHHLEINKKLESGVPSKIRAGGQSAARFQRIREEKIHSFLKRVAEHARNLYVIMREEQGEPQIKGLLIGGPGPIKERFVNEDYLDYRLREGLLEITDTGYADEQGIKELIEKAQETLNNLRYMQEKRLMQQFLEHLGKDTGLVAYGDFIVRHLLELGAVKILLLSTELDKIKVPFRCDNCDYTEERTTTQTEFSQMETDVSGSLCPKCGSSTFHLDEDHIITVIEEFAELAKMSGTKIEIITTETEEGEQLWRVFGGIAAILRFKPS